MSGKEQSFGQSRTEGGEKTGTSISMTSARGSSTAGTSGAGTSSAGNSSAETSSAGTSSAGTSGTGTSSTTSQPEENAHAKASQELASAPPSSSATGARSGQRKQVTFAMGHNGGGGGRGGGSGGGRNSGGGGSNRGGNGGNRGGRHRHYHLHPRRRPGTLSGDEEPSVGTDVISL